MDLPPSDLLPQVQRHVENYWCGRLISIWIKNIVNSTFAAISFANWVVCVAVRRVTMDVIENLPTYYFTTKLYFNVFIISCSYRVLRSNTNCKLRSNLNLDGSMYVCGSVRTEIKILLQIWNIGVWSRYNLFTKINVWPIN